MKAKKSLGQNFLKSKSALSAIKEAAALSKEDLVLEIGPGKGALTEVLVQTAGKVIAVEKDESLAEYLKEKFKEEINGSRLNVIANDILEFNPKDLELKPSEYKIVANIPYYITGAMLRKFLAGKNQPSRMVLLLQKEVAKRIVAADRKESLLSLSVKAYGRPRYIKTVPARFFAPAPKVDSAILLIENISRDFFTCLAGRQAQSGAVEERFFAVLKAGFAHKRKYLISNLKEEAPLSGAASWQELFQKNQISEKVRAEDLSLEEWAKLGGSDS